MRVHADRPHPLDPEALLAMVAARLAGAEMAAGRARVDALTVALIAAGELARGLADAEAEAAGEDDPGAAQAATMRLSIAIAARLLVAAGLPARTLADPAPLLADLAGRRLPRLRGAATRFDVHPLYPEGYAAAAARIPRGPLPLVIGLRGGGASLAAVVAARLGGAAVTARPFGPVLRLSEAFRARLRAHPGRFIVVGDGPGPSGRAFGAAGDALEDLGVDLGRIVFMPGHSRDLGPEAMPAHRARWAAASRLAGGAAPAPATVAGWFADIVGPEGKAEDFSAGKWRAHLAGAHRCPAAPEAERPKVLIAGPRGRFLARFAGLGDIGARKFAAARRLHGVGFTPEPLALRRGFLLERWVTGPPPRATDAADLAWIGRYIGFRARALPVPGEGASLAELGGMAVHNTRALAGDALAEAVERGVAGIDRLDGLAPAWIDGRMHLWEWRRAADGGLCKTDALDHAVSRELVGCQDVAWDIAGAGVELRLRGETLDLLRRAVEKSAGRPVNPEAVAVFRLCYAAFQAGLWRMFGEPGPRAAREVERYHDDLRRSIIARPRAPARPDTSDLRPG